MFLPISIWKFILLYCPTKTLINLSITSKDNNNELKKTYFLDYYVKNKYNFLNDMLKNIPNKLNIVLLPLYHNLENKYLTYLNKNFYELRIKKQCFDILKDRLKYASKEELKNHPMFIYDKECLEKINKKIIKLEKDIYKSNKNFRLDLMNNILNLF